MSRALILAVVVAAFSFTAVAQTATGILQGSVTDASGAAVPDAVVIVENQRTAVKQTLTTNSEGRFVQPFLIPSEYRVTVEKPGFQKYVATDIRVDVQQTAALEISLKLGEVSTAVEVIGSAVQLSTATSSLSTVIDNKRILDLPLNGRNPFGLASLVPGVIPGGGATPWISGGRNASSDITVDGTSIILPENNTGITQLGYTPIVDSIEEFSVITNSLAAEYGRTGGGVINVATRSGTTSLHFTLFEFLRNSKLDANTWSNNRNGAPLPPLQRNEFGGTVGGPVKIPGLYNGQGKTFFFFSQQSIRSRSGASATATVPIEAWKNGDFSDLRNGAGQLVTLYDPYDIGPDGTRQPFPGNKIPVSRFNTIAKNLLQYFPQPNAAPTNAFTHVNNYFLSGKSPSLNNKFDARLDHNFSSKLRLWARGSREHSQSEPLNGFRTLGTSSGDGPSETYNHNFALNTVYTLSNHTILNFNYGVGRRGLTRFPFSRDFDIRTLGFPQYVYDTAAKLGLEFPRFNFGGNTNISSLGQATFTTLLDRDLAHAFRADLTKVRGTHTMKFGFEFRKLFLNFTQLGQPDGEYTFGSQWTQRTAGTTTTSTTQGNGFASFLLGVPNSGTMEHTFDIASASDYYGVYVQDDWKLTRKLTLNLGLRWDLDTPHTERFNRLSYWDVDAPSPIAGKVPGYPDLKGAMRFTTADHRRQVPMDLNNWGPRFGFAYQITSRTVFRGAYGMMYAPSVLQASGTSGSSGTQGFRSSTGMTVSTDNTNILATLSNPFPSGFNLPLGALEGPTSGASTQLGLGIGESFFNDSRNPVIQQWNANLQRELPGGWVVEVAYLGSKGQHLPDGESSMEFNQLPPSYFALGDRLLNNPANQVPNPFFGIITNPTSTLSRATVPYSQLLRRFPQYTGVGAFRKPQGNSLYHSFTMRVEKRFSRGLSALVSYTASKLLDDVSQQVTFLGQAGTKQDFYNRGAERSVSSQDISQRIVISGNYDLPFGRNHKFLGSIPSAVDFIVGGWQLNGIATFQTGLPLAIGNGGNFTNIYATGQRPNSNGKDPKIEGGIDERINQYFDTTTFSQAGNFTFGTASRFDPKLRGPGTNNVDFSLFKNFRYRELFKFQVRAEAFNIANHPIWNSPGTTVNDLANFGKITAKGGQRRQIQIGLKLIF
jgi:hypothetical protein